MAKERGQSILEVVVHDVIIQMFSGASRLAIFSSSTGWNDKRNGPLQCEKCSRRNGSPLTCLKVLPFRSNDRDATGWCLPFVRHFHFQQSRRAYTHIINIMQGLRKHID